MSAPAQVSWADVRRERRTLEDQIRKDLARIERLDPAGQTAQEVMIALSALRETWHGELEDLDI